MREFRNDLLDMLLAEGGFVDIKPLVNKYCGEENYFEDGDNTKVSCRLNINLVLRELKEMNWINTTGDLSTGHHMNHEIGKREFILDYPVKARMTTTGEMEYNKIKKEQVKEKPSIQIGEGFSGVFIQDSDLRDSMIGNKVTHTHNIKSNTNPITGFSKFIANPLVKFILAIVAGLVIAYFVFLFKWNK